MKPCLVLMLRLQGGVFPLFLVSPLRPILPTCCYSHQLTLLSDNAGNEGFVLHFCLTMSKIFQFCRDMIVLTSSFTLSDYKYEFLWLCSSLQRERGIRLSSALLGLNWQRFDNVCRIIRWNQSQVEDAPQLCLNKIHWACFLINILLINTAHIFESLVHKMSS